MGSSIYSVLPIIHPPMDWLSDLFNHRLAEFLFTYRFTKHATTNVSPSELFLKRKLRTRVDLLKPDIKNFVSSKQAEQKSHHDGSAKLRILFPGQSVMVMNYRSSDKWIPGTVLKKLGPVTYCIEIDNGKIVKRHIDQLRHSSTPSGPSTPHISNPDRIFKITFSILTIKTTYLLNLNRVTHTEFAVHPID